jgi:hypothetical protein
MVTGAEDILADDGSIILDGEMVRVNCEFVGRIHLLPEGRFSFEGVPDMDDIYSMVRIDGASSSTLEI